MKKIILLFLLAFISCKSSYHLTNKKFIGDYEMAYIEMDFVNDTICKVHQIYKCDSLPKELKELRYTCRYEIKKMRFKKYINSLGKEKILKRDNFKFVKVLFLYPEEKSDALFPLKYYSKCKMPQAYSKVYKKQDFYKLYYFIKPHTTHLISKKGIDFNP